MHCIAAISLDGFYMSALTPELSAEEACVVVAREKRVLDSSQPARKRGVYTGQSVAEARAILGKEGSFIDWKEGRFTKASEKWLDVVAEFTGAIEPQSEHRALLDLSGHPDPLKAAEELRQAVQKIVPTVAIGLGPNRWIADVALTEGPLSLAPLVTPRRFIAPFPTLRLEPVEWKDRERLMALGYRTIGEVAALSSSTLRELFEKRAFLIAMAAQGSGTAEVESLYPKASRAEFFAFETPPENWAEVEDARVRIAKNLAAILLSQDRITYDLEVVASLDDGSRIAVARSFTKPLTTAKSIDKALGLMIAKPYDLPLERLLVRLKNLERPKRVQSTLEGFVRGSEKNVALEQALKSLKATFGAQAVEQAGSIQRARYQDVRKAWQEVNGWAWG